MKGYYSVYNPRHEKIADCGIEPDAINLMCTRNKYWDGHYFKFTPSQGDIIDMINISIEGTKEKMPIPIQQDIDLAQLKLHGDKNNYDTYSK